MNSTIQAFLVPNLIVLLVSFLLADRWKGFSRFSSPHIYQAMCATPIFADGGRKSSVAVSVWEPVQGMSPLEYFRDRFYCIADAVRQRGSKLSRRESGVLAELPALIGGV
ncbi:hypothetical protein B0H19DRAFT_1120394 [Mycena capillaripes]|nr:hypothetical protein B0H19DRAFT_1120394 [Mycena capillaripes]